MRINKFLVTLLFVLISNTSHAASNSYTVAAQGPGEIVVSVSKNLDKFTAKSYSIPPIKFDVLCKQDSYRPAYITIADTYTSKQQKSRVKTSVSKSDPSEFHQVFQGEAASLSGSVHATTAISKCKSAVNNYKRAGKPSGNFHSEVLDVTMSAIMYCDSFVPIYKSQHWSDVKVPAKINVKCEVTP